MDGFGRDMDEKLSTLGHQHHKLCKTSSTMDQTHYLSIYPPDQYSMIEEILNLDYCQQVRIFYYEFEAIVTLWSILGFSWKSNIFPLPQHLPPRNLCFHKVLPLVNILMRCLEYSPIPMHTSIVGGT